MAPQGWRRESLLEKLLMTYSQYKLQCKMTNERRSILNKSEFYFRVILKQTSKQANKKTKKKKQNKIKTKNTKKTKHSESLI